ncbi:MAG: alpha/beta hydrolase [Bacteriovorax sp.]|nr:alpha/beta hydrolase [Bacteriovorax sp.]
MNQRPIYFNSGEAQLFGWLHLNKNIPLRNCGVVICNPNGHEYIHGHRSVRHLASKISDNGIPTLRFDYHGVGNSTGYDSDNDRINQWQKNIVSAISYLRSAYGCEKICLIGFRFGASLAARVSCFEKINFLVLWSPVVNGKKYIRELQTIALSAQDTQSFNKNGINSAGIVLSPETIENLKKLNLLEEQFEGIERTLFIHRDDLQYDDSLVKNLKEQKIPVDEINYSGHVKMMAEPQFNEVPEIAISQISDWLIKQTTTAVESDNQLNLKEVTSTIRFQFSDNDSNQYIGEQIHLFGKNKDIFGVLSFSYKILNDKPIVILLNSGSVHHVGPHGLYVELARCLAADGFTTLRMDLHGLGDSGLKSGYEENNPYPEFAVSDVEEALSFLKDTFGQNQFILMGICSGAHTAFHSAIEISNEFNIVETVLINPLTFRWVEGMSLETSSQSTTRHFQDVAYYKSKIRDPQNWKKALKGNIQFRYGLKVLYNWLRRLFSSFFNSSSSTELSRDIQKLFKRCPSLSLFISQNDPGFDLLLSGAKSLVVKELKSKKIRVQFIENADHTFSALKARKELIQKIRSQFKRLFT